MLVLRIAAGSYLFRVEYNAFNPLSLYYGEMSKELNERHLRLTMSYVSRGGVSQAFAFFEDFDLPELLRATA